MSGNEGENQAVRPNGNGVTRQLFITFMTIIGSLVAAGVIGLVVMYGRMSAMDTTIVAQNNLIISLTKRVEKMEGDIYRPVFGRAKGVSYATKFPAPKTVSSVPAVPKVQ